MKNRRIDPGALIVTLVCGIVGAFILELCGRDLVIPGFRVLWMGAAFTGLYLMGFAGLHVYLHFSKYRIHRSPRWIAAACISAVLIFVVGAVSQFFYMYSRDRITHTTITDEKVDMVLLLDASGSMTYNGYDIARNDASAQFVDSLNDQCQLQAVTFAGAPWALGQTELLPMDDSGKTNVKQFIYSIDCEGLTNFDAALGAAVYTLTSDPAVRADSSKAAILLTDAQDHDLTDTYFKPIQDAGIKLFTIRISDDASISASMQRLIDLAVSTGGSDTYIAPRADGTIDASSMLQAFQDAFRSTSETETEIITDYTENLLIYTDSVGLGRHWLRTAALMLICVLIGFGYFGKLSLPGILGNAGAGLVLSVIVATMGTGSGLISSLAVAVVFLVPAFVSFNIAGGDMLDV